MAVPQTWHTLESARSEWRDAPADDDALQTLLDVAKQQVIAYGPALEYDTIIPVNFRLAQLMQARNLWQSVQTDPQGQMGDEGFVLRPYPMDWVVKNIIRPKRGVPVVG